MSRRRPGTRRPWKVFVHSIGPKFSYATEDKARAMAARLVGPAFDHGKYNQGNYERVTVYDADSWGRRGVPIERTVYRGNGAVYTERLLDGAWRREFAPEAIR